MKNVPMSDHASSWQKLAQIGLIILALAFVSDWAWSAQTREALSLALSAMVVLAVTAVHALTETRKTNPFLRSPH